MSYDTAIPLPAAHTARNGPGLTLSKAQWLVRQRFGQPPHPPGVIAACTAEMSCFRPDPQAPATDGAEHGPSLHEGLAAKRMLAEAFAARMKSLFEWDVHADQVMVLASAAQAIHAAVLAFSDPGDGVVVQVPSDPGLREAIAASGRRPVPLDMEPGAAGHVFQLDELEKLVTRCTRVLLLCNPQDPTGRVFSCAELQSLAAFAERHDLIVVSDETLCDLVYPGQRHLPFAALSAAAAARTVTLHSAAKGFDMPGLRCAVACFGTKALLRRFHACAPARVTGGVNELGIGATLAAWTTGQAWLDALRAHLMAMRTHVADTLRRELPALRFHEPQATPLAWLDCTGLALEGSAAEFFLQRARVAFGPGEAFHPRAQKFVRMNFAVPKPTLDEMLDRMITAVDDHNYLRRLKTGILAT
ncbi:MAG: aminotransferase class I/II-fold pyridoxal phosphate-dependent enzyme [Pseudomonadota bacterium]